MELNLGIRAHDIENQTTIEGLVEEIAGKGLTGVQLALGKSFEDINSSLGSLSPGFAKHIGGKFAEKNVQISVLGCYIHMIHPDKEKRQQNWIVLKSIFVLQEILVAASLELKLVTFMQKEAIRRIISKNNLSSMSLIVSVN